MNSPGDFIEHKIGFLPITRDEQIFVLGLNLEKKLTYINLQSAESIGKVYKE